MAEAQENKTNITLEIIKDYDLSKGSQFFIQEVTGNYAWGLDIKYENVVSSGALNGEVSILGSNQLETDEDFYTTFTSTSKVVINGVKGKKILSDSFLPLKVLGIKLDVKDLTGGKLSIILSLNRIV